MLEFITLTSEVSTVAQPPLWWTWVGGPAVVGTILTGIFAIVTKRTKTPQDIHEQTQTLLEGLRGMLNIMTEEKTRDADRISMLQSRIDILEALSGEDLEYRNRVFSEIQELKEEVARKSQHINLLVAELAALGVTVGGVDAGMHHTLTFTRNH